MCCFFFLSLIRHSNPTKSNKLFCLGLETISVFWKERSHSDNRYFTFSQRAVGLYAYHVNISCRFHLFFDGGRALLWIKRFIGVQIFRKSPEVSEQQMFFQKLFLFSVFSFQSKIFSDFFISQNRRMIPCVFVCARVPLIQLSPSSVLTSWSIHDLHIPSDSQERLHECNCFFYKRGVK